MFSLLPPPVTSRKFLSVRRWLVLVYNSAMLWIILQIFPFKCFYLRVLFCIRLQLPFNSFNISRVQRDRFYRQPSSLTLDFSFSWKREKERCFILPEVDEWLGVEFSAVNSPVGDLCLFVLLMAEFIEWKAVRSSHGSSQDHGSQIKCLVKGQSFL